MCGGTHLDCGRTRSIDVIGERHFVVDGYALLIAREIRVLPAQRKGPLAQLRVGGSLLQEVERASIVVVSVPQLLCNLVLLQEVGYKPQDRAHENDTARDVSRIHVLLLPDSLLAMNGPSDA